MVERDPRKNNPFDLLIPVKATIYARRVGKIDCGNLNSMLGYPYMENNVNLKRGLEG